MLEGRAKKFSALSLASMRFLDAREEAADKKLYHVQTSGAE